MKRFTAMRLSPAAHAAALALLIVATALNAGRVTAAGEAEPIQFAVNARVVDATGWPIENVRVSIAGSSSATEVTGTNGRALLRVPIGTPAEIAAHTVELTVEAGEKKPAYALTDGSAALRIEIASTGQTLAVRSSSAAMTTAVARMLRVSEGRSIAIELLFLATPPGDVKRVAALGPAEEVLLTGSQATAAPVKPAPPPAGAQQRASAPAESTHAARAEPSRAKPERHATTARPPAKPVNVTVTSPPPAANTARSQGAVTSPSPTPKPSPPPSATSESPPARPAPQPSVVGTSSQTTRTVPHVISTPSEEVPVLNAPRPPRENEKECRCRLTGSVEVNWDRPLSRPLYVRVSLLDQPAVHDSLTLFMGSPRGFVLDDVTCGAHRVLVTLPGREPFVVATPESGLLFTCERAWLRPMRVTLVRR